MDGRALTARLARSAARRPRRVLAIWAFALVVAAVGIPLLLPGALTPEFEVTNRPESERARETIRERLPQAAGADEVLIVRGGADAGPLIEEIRSTPGVDRVLDEVRSADGDALLVPIDLAPDQERSGDAIEHIVEVTRAADFEAYVTGEASTGVDIGELSERDLRKGEFGFGMPAALIILCFVFGTFVAAAVPLLLAMFAILISLTLIGLLGQWHVWSIFAVNMITGMGLALGIDYALFVLSRYREERAQGRSVEDAVVTAGATSSRAVFFSGFAFVVALAAMLITPLSILQSLAAGAIAVAVVAVAAALTLLPAVIALLGDRLERWRVPYFGKAAARAAVSEDGFWARTARAVMRRPVISLVLGVALLLAAAAPMLDFKIGSAGVMTLPDGYPSREGLEALAQEFPRESATQLQVVVTGDAAPADGLAATISRTPPFGEARVVASDGVTLISAPVTGDPRGEAATEAVRELRADVIPRAFDGVDATVLVGGGTAEAVDYFDANTTWLPRVVAMTLALSFILLTVAFRSIVVPLKAIVLNLLSVGAAYGLLVLVFIHGVGAGLLGFTQVDSIEAWVPLFLFSVLFALSMDYHVFLLSRIRERYDRTGDNAEAVAGAVGSTARLITGAALIIIAVFVGFALADLVMFQQMGFGVAVALLIDATLVRSVILPASMKLLGARNWYLPSWLRWLPDVGEAEKPRVEALH